MTGPIRASLVLIPLALVMAALGWWQLDRMKAKQSLQSSFNDATELGLDEAVQGDVPFARVSSNGRFDSERHILLDNQVLNGKAGVHVFTPFRTMNGTEILVNRGWKPMAPDRGSLPEIWTPTVPVRISGILAPPPEHRQKLGEPDELTRDDWPQLVTYLDIATASAALDATLPSWVIWLDPEDPNGFDGRDWAPAVMTPERHRAYAVQWFALAATALAILVVLSIRDRKNRHENQQ